MDWRSHPSKLGWSLGGNAKVLELLCLKVCI